VYKKKKSSIHEVLVFTPSIRIPIQSDLQRPLKGLIPKDLADKFSSLRNQIVLVAEDTGLFTKILLFLVSVVIKMTHCA
jgi:hypothetical protein